MNKIFSRLKILFILLRLLPALSNRKGKIENPKRIVIFQLAKLGDMVCTTPMFKAIKEHYPYALLTVVGDEVNKRLLEGHPHVDNYIVWDKNNPLSIVPQMRKVKFDFGVTTGPNFEALAVLMLAHVPAIAVPTVENGWSPYETLPYRFLRRYVITKPHRMGTYAPREYLRLLEPLDIYIENTKKYLSYSERALEVVREFCKTSGLEERKFAIISPSVGNKIKAWPPERFSKVADFLSSQGWPVVVVGGKRDIEEVSLMMNQILKDSKVINTLEKFNLDEFKVLISQAGLLIAVDTGPVYIAEAFDIPTVDIVGPMDEREQPPIGKKHKVVLAEREKAQLHIMNARAYDKSEARRQVESIGVEAVIGKVRELLSDVS